MSNEEAKAAVQAILNTAGIVYAVTGGTQIKHNDWDCFQWFAAFRKGKDSFSFDYYTGLGLVTKPGRFSSTRPITPHAADVLHSLLLDGGASDQSFNDWCADYSDGDTDSIKAFNTYQLCCETGQKLRKLFTRAEREALQTALQDY